MTLFKQILLGAVVFTLIILGVVSTSNYLQTNDFVREQLGANAKNTAISLGLVILNEANKATKINDNLDDDELNINSLDQDKHSSKMNYSKIITPEFLKALISPIFDSGYYSSISFKDADDKVIYEASAKTKIYGVRDWFVNLVRIDTPIASQEVRSWGKIGTISVQISPAFAYSQMYYLLKYLAYSLGAIFIVAFILIYFALRAVLAPLNRVRKQAEAILENEFIIQDKLPFTQEVRKMVLAMNSMVGKVRIIYEKETHMLDRYNELLYIDEATRLYNRRFFANKYKECLASEEFSSGYFMLLSIKETYNLKKLLGFARSVEFLSSVAELLRNEIKGVDKEHIFRLNENEFAMLLFRQSEISAKFLKLLDSCKALFDKYGLDANEFSVKIAFTHFDKSPQHELLSRVDVLLMQADNNFSLNGSLEAKGDFVLGKEEYKDFIMQAIKDDKFSFATQDVKENNYVLHKELYLRLKLESGELKSAAYFMPIITELNLSDELDFYVIEKALKLSSASTDVLAINISANFIKSKNHARLARLLDAFPKAAISFELAMNKSLNISDVIAFAKFIRKWNIPLGLDHFGLSKENLMILNELNVSYVKTPVNTLLDLLEDQNTSGAANSLEIILNSKNVQIIVIGIENELNEKAVKKLHISALQGRYISEIKDL